MHVLILRLLILFIVILVFILFALLTLLPRRRFLLLGRIQLIPQSPKLGLDRIFPRLPVLVLDCLNAVQHLDFFGAYAQFGVWSSF